MDTAPVLPTSPTGLFWSERGMVNCDRHAPYRGSDTWRWERWLPLLAEDAAAWQAQTGDLPACECCGRVAAMEPA